MKIQNRLIKLLIGIFVFIAACSSNDDEVDNRIEYTTCYKFIERGSNVPIQDLSILIHSARPSGVDRVDQGITDADGNFCFDHTGLLGEITIFRILGAGDLQREGNGYFIPSGGVPYKIDVSVPIQSIIELDPISYLKFHIQNTSPINDNDEIFINYSFRYDFRDNSYWNLWIQGKEIDTTFVTHTRAGSNKIEWETRLDGIGNSQKSINILSVKKDTLYVEILY